MVEEEADRSIHATCLYGIARELFCSAELGFAEAHQEENQRGEESQGQDEEGIHLNILFVFMLFVCFRFLIVCFHFDCFFSLFLCHIQWFELTEFDFVSYNGEQRKEPVYLHESHEL